jgi:hypothetical protein
MSDLWSGPGCENNPDFELVSRDPMTGIGRFRKVGPKRFIGHAPGMVPVYKRAEHQVPAPTSEDSTMRHRDAVYAAINKLAGAKFPEIPRAQAVEKFLRTEAGAALYSLHETLATVEKAGASFEKAAATAILDAKAALLRKANPALTAEQAFVAAMAKNPAVAAAAIG